LFFHSCFSALRACTGALRLHGKTPTPFAKLVVATLFLPVLTVISILFRIYTAYIGPYRVEVLTQWGERFVCTLPDSVQFWIYLLGIWEPDITAFVRRSLSAGDTFVDVGAHAGYFTVLASSLAGETGRVVAVEPCPRNFAALTANLELEKARRNVRPVNMAAGATRGTVGLYSRSDWAADRATTMPTRLFAVESRVEAAPLEEILTPDEIRNVRVMKIDVEGTELEVIAGMKSILRNCRADAEFIIELTPRWWPGEDKSVLHALQPFFDAGFHAYHIDNFYRPWRYLWAAATRPARRVGARLPAMEQYVMVLSRREAKEL
jgi:FkbM family methyltransferase